MTISFPKRFSGCWKIMTTKNHARIVRLAIEKLQYTKIKSDTVNVKEVPCFKFQLWSRILRKRGRRWFDGFFPCRFS